MHRRAFRIAYALWLFGIFAYFVPAATWSPVSRFGLTRALVERGDVTVDPWADATGDRSFRNGHWFTDKAPVPSFMAVPFYAVAHAWDTAQGQSPQFTSISTPDTPARHVSVNRTFSRSLYVSSLATAGAAGVALALLVFEWLSRRFSAGAALCGSLAITLGTPIFPYATSFYGHVVAGAFLFGGFFALTLEEGSRRATRVAGLLMVLAVGTEYITLFPVLVVSCWAMFRARRNAPEVALDLVLGGLAPAIAVAAYHTVCFGSPIATGYSFLPRAEFARGHAGGFMGIHLASPTALAGLLIGPRRGLFFLAPVTVLGAVGLALTKLREARVGAAMFVVLLLANAGYYMWWGGAATGPRHLVPVLPFLAIGVAWAWDRNKRPVHAAVLVLVVISVANMLAFTAVGLEAPEHGNALFEYAWPRLFARKIAHLTGATNLGLRLGLPRYLSLAPLFVWLVVGLRYLLRQLAEPSPEETTLSDSS